jgi:paraquat-inducible protein B
MPEQNGNREARLDRIERALELLIADHEQFRHEHKQLLTAQVLQKESIDQLFEITKKLTAHAEETDRRLEQTAKRLFDLGEKTDQRINALVSAIGQFLRKQNAV